MKIIITMAGLGSRFKNIGIKIPKYKIIAKHRTLFEWSMLSLKDFFDMEFIFVIRKEILDEQFILDKCSQLGIEKLQIVVIDKNTDGQATTAMMADDFINEDEEIVIYNIDTYVEPYNILKNQIKSSYIGFIPVIVAEGDRWSFVKVNELGEVIDVAEKKPISNLATIGLYYFKKWGLFKTIYTNMKSEILLNNKETYIAPMYKSMIENNQKIGVSIIDYNNVFILGTPEEISIFDKDYIINNE